MCGCGSCTGLHYNKPDFLSQILRSSVIIEQSSSVFNAWFHLSKDFIKNYLNEETFQYLNIIHHGAHGIEETLEATSFIKDGIDFYRNDFIIRGKDSGKMDYLKTGARVAHFISHILRPIVFLSDLKILTLSDKVGRVFKIGIPIFHLIGFSAYIASLLWERYTNDIQEGHFYSDLVIQTGNVVFYALLLAKSAFHLQGTAAKIVTFMSVVAGLTSSLFILYRLHSIEGQSGEMEKEIEYPHLEECNHTA